MSSLTATCPAASLVSGAWEKDTTVICGVLANDRDQEDQGRYRGKLQNVTFTLAKDPSTVRKACCADYSSCLIWRAEVDRLAALKKKLEPTD